MAISSVVARQSVDLSGYPDLVVIYLGMRVERARGLRTLFRIGPAIEKAARTKPDGLLLHEGGIIYSLFPLHVGMRQYWRDLDCLEAWSRSLPHKDWWVDFLRNPGGTSFWHETYLRAGGIEAIYDDVGSPVGLARFLPAVPAKGRMMSSRGRLGLGDPKHPAPASAPAAPEPG